MVFYFHFLYFDYTKKYDIPIKSQLFNIIHYYEWSKQYFNEITIF
jgi:hypothetical protein